jgi:hypothetical protein
MEDGAPTPRSGCDAAQEGEGIEVLVDFPEKGDDDAQQVDAAERGADSDLLGCRDFVHFQKR